MYLIELSLHLTYSFSSRVFFIVKRELILLFRVCITKIYIYDPLINILLTQMMKCSSWLLLAMLNIFIHIIDNVRYWIYTQQKNWNRQMDFIYSLGQSILLTFSSLLDGSSVPFYCHICHNFMRFSCLLMSSYRSYRLDYSMIW